MVNAMLPSVLVTLLFTYFVMISSVNTLAIHPPIIMHTANIALPPPFFADILWVPEVDDFNK
jgi:hypothetical protein